MPKEKKDKMDLLKFNFLYDNVVVKAIRTEGKEGLVKPDQYDDKPEYGEVVAHGEGRLLEDGGIVPIKVSVGDTVFFGKYSTEQTRHLGKDYFILKEEDIKAVLRS